MSKKIILTILGAIVGLVGLFLLIAVLMIPGQQEFKYYSKTKDQMSLAQNWSDDIRQQMHYTSFGSRIMPYDLFENLAVADSETLLSSDSVMESLGFIVQGKADNNPAALPIGFAIDYGDEDWVGMTCAACHTGELRYQGKKMVIDGGPGMLEFDAFEQIVYEALTASIDRPDKFKSLIKRMGLSTQKDVDRVRERLVERAEFFKTRIARNQVDVPYGYGRLDAFGRIFNAVTSAALELPDNYHKPNAPVSIPMLWGASHLDLVQWNASAPNKNPGPLGQNVTTVLAVYGQIDMTGNSIGYPSSAKIANLGYIQSHYYLLKAPTWPTEVLGEIDREKAAQGKKLYVENCSSCHEMVDSSDDHRMMKAKVIPLNEVNTDPMMAKNFATFKSKTGLLEGTKQAIVAGPKFGEDAATIDIVVNATIGAMLQKPLETLSAIIAEERKVYSASMDMTRQAYKARPLNGVWATGPFLHNGSVPTLYDLLQPAGERPQTFFVGSREMDIQKVGLQYTESAHSSLFDTNLKGNSNVGHEFGAHLSDEEKWALVEFMKSL